MAKQTYLIAIGSNRYSRWGSPYALLTHLTEGHPPLLCGFAALRDKNGLTQRRKDAKEEGKIVTLSRIVESAPIGPGQRRYANAVALVESRRSPPKMLKTLKRIERAAGRRAGRRWGDRVLDLDIIGWSGGIWVSPGLTVPHPAFRQRRFVLAPLCEIAPDWRDPVTHLTARQLLARLDRKRPRA